MYLEVRSPKEGLTVGENVYEIIKANIINLNLKPGTRISEKEISELLKVSRTPVREAFIKLSKEGLLYILPQRGTYISHIDLDLVEDARFIRESLEKTILKIATENFPEDYLLKLERNIEIQKSLIGQKRYYEFLETDEEFHKTIFAGCNRERTWSFIEQINSEYKRVRMLTFLAEIDWGNVIMQHIEIMESIRQRDEERGQRVISNHIGKLVLEQVELKKKYPHYFKTI